MLKLTVNLATEMREVKMELHLLPNIFAYVTKKPLSILVSDAFYT